MNPDGKMRLGLSLEGLGYHLAAWRHPDVPSGGSLDIQFYCNSVRMAEESKFDTIFFADGNAVRAQDNPPGSLCRSHDVVKLEPTTLLASLAMVTKHIGLVATASTTYNQPYHVARRFASLDHISGGRAGWNIVTSWSIEEALNFNLEKTLDYDTRYARAAEFVEVVKGLWKTWDEDALVMNKETGVFYDSTKMHVLGHKGEFFKVKGPLNISSTPQRRPLMFQAGSAVQGREIAATSADAVYTAIGTLEESLTFYRDLKERTIAHGRDPDSIKIMAGISPFVAPTRAEAQAKFDQMQELIDPMLGIAQLYDKFGDLTGYPVDGPVPDKVDDPQMRSKTEEYHALARSKNLSIRDLYMVIAAGSMQRVSIGSHKDIADEMQEWYEAGACDGMNICPPYTPNCVQDFCQLVVPELQRRGIFRTEYEGKTFRENMGLVDYVDF